MSYKIFNWKENCRSIIETGKYSTIKHQGQEQIVLVRYLLDLGKTRQEVYDFWKTTDSRIVKAANEDLIELEIGFNNIFRCAQKTRILEFQQVHTISIYNSDIDFLNSLDCPLWVQKYLLALLCVSRYYGSVDVICDSELEHFLFNKAGKLTTSLTYYKKVLQELRAKYNLYSFSVSSGNYLTRYLKLGFGTISSDSTIVGCIASPNDCDKLFGLLQEQTVACVKCGKSISRYNHLKRKMFLCDECYKKFRLNQKHKDRQS